MSVAVIRRKDATTLFESVELDLDEVPERSLLHVTGAERSQGRAMLAVTTRRLVVFRDPSGYGTTERELFDLPIHRSTTWDQLLASARAVIVRGAQFPFAAGVSFPLRSVWNIGDNPGFVFEDHADFDAVAGALDELAPFLALHGVALTASHLYRRLDLPQPAVEPT